MSRPSYLKFGILRYWLRLHGHTDLEGEILAYMTLKADPKTRLSYFTFQDGAVMAEYLGVEHADLMMTHIFMGDTEVLIEKTSPTSLRIPYRIIASPLQKPEGGLFMPDEISGELHVVHDPDEDPERVHINTQFMRNVPA